MEDFLQYFQPKADQINPYSKLHTSDATQHVPLQINEMQYPTPLKGNKSGFEITVPSVTSHYLFTFC